MVLPLVLSILAELSAHIAFAEPCGGMKGVYVCNPGNPTRFDICIGEQKYTMSCPGGLHFNARTQVCDWPQNADCGQSSAGPSPFAREGPKPHYRKSPSPPGSQKQPQYRHHEPDSQPPSPRHDQDRYHNYDSQQQHRGSPSQRQSRRRLGGHVRAPQSSNDPRFRLYGPRGQSRGQQDVVRYDDNDGKFRQSPFAYKDRRAQSQPATKDGPATPGEQDRDDKKTSFKASAINKPEDFKASKNQVAQENDVNEKKTAQDPLPAQKTDRSYKKNSNYGDSEKKTIYNGNGNNFYGNDKNSNNNANNNINNNDNNINNNINNNGNSKRNDRFSLHHYPWWASRSSTPRSLRRRFPQPTMRPPRQYSQKRYQRPSGQNTKSGSQRGLAPSYQPAPAPRQSPPRHVPPRQPLSAAAAAAPPAKSITAAAASAPKRVKKPRKTGYCKPETCKLPDCRCVGPDIPGGLDVKDTPQMVMLTFDDSVNIANYDYFTKLFDETKFRNPNGCPIKGTFFVSGDATQYHYVEKLYKRGHEIASHSMSHRSPTTYWAHAGYDGYVNEIEGMRKKLTKASKVPKKDIKGMRVPFLQVGGDDQYQMLEDYGYLYDTSMVTGHLYRNDHAPIWPFTLDYPPNSKTCSLTPCPTKSYPGLWEVPLIRWYGSNRLACAMPDGCTIGVGRKGTLQFLEDNFKRHYETNRSPVGIFLHASWFRRKDGNLEGLLEFLEKLNDMKDVWVVSVSQVIDWIQNPVPNSQAGAIASWSCD